VIAHELQHVENKELLRKKAEKEFPSEEEENKKEVADKDDDDMDEELVDFEDSQDRQLEQQEDEDDWPESQESFGTKFWKITGEGVKQKSVKQEKSNKIGSSTEEPRRCPRLRSQEDADRNELAMKRTEKKNSIQGNVPDNNLEIPTILNSKDELLVALSNKIGVVSSNEKFIGLFM
jgi:hypothetical protein